MAEIRRSRTHRHGNASFPGHHQVWEPCGKMTLDEQQINQTPKFSAGLLSCEARGQMHRLWKPEPLHWSLRSPERVLSSSIQIRVNFSAVQRGSAIGKLCTLNSAWESSGSAVNTEPPQRTPTVHQGPAKAQGSLPYQLFPRYPRFSLSLSRGETHPKSGRW